MIVKIRMNVPDSFIEVDIDEYRNGMLNFLIVWGG